MGLREEVKGFGMLHHIACLKVGGFDRCREVRRRGQSSCSHLDGITSTMASCCASWYGLCCKIQILVGLAIVLLPSIMRAMFVAILTVMCGL